MVLDSPYRLDVESVRGGEERTQSFAYVFDVLAVLTVVHVAREDALRIVSFRPASEEERSAYHDWLEVTSTTTDEMCAARKRGEATRMWPRCGPEHRTCGTARTRTNGH
jgi:hypothetical protein